MTILDLFRNSKTKPVRRVSALPRVPEGWLVYQLYQEPLFLLWGCICITWSGDPKYVVHVEEYTLPEEAIQACIVKINLGDIEPIAVEGSVANDD